MYSCKKTEAYISNIGTRSAQCYDTTNFRGSFVCVRTVDGNVCIVDTSLRKYIPKYIKSMSNRNKITCGCKTCISVMLLQSYINKLRLLKFSKLDQLYIYSASTRHLQRSKNDFIKYKNQILPNNPHKI